LKHLGVGLYGENGHQIQGLLKDHPKAQLIGVSHFAHSPTGVKTYADLEEMLQDDAISLVSLCSPNRAEQAEQAVRCMRSGKHVYAEKPCALTEEELDRVMAAAQETGMHFHEMAGTALEEPYLSMGEIVRAGGIGPVIQVFAQKSYPYHDARPQDEAVDGGMLCQAGVHALRWIEHTAGIRIQTIHALETKLGNPAPEGALRMAAALMMTLENGGVASVLVNYLNPRGHGQWGNDHLRIFGSKGFVEATDGGTYTRWIAGDTDKGDIPRKADGPSFFDAFVNALTLGTAMPFSPEEELHPTRMILRAKAGSGVC
jgi:predicted dehydrogenase